MRIRVRDSAGVRITTPILERPIVVLPGKVVLIPDSRDKPLAVPPQQISLVLLKVGMIADGMQ